MTTKDQLVEQHIREYESRLKHLHELLEQANRASGNHTAVVDSSSELEEYRAQHAKLTGVAKDLKKMPLAHWKEETIRAAGPLAVFDILAQKIEDLIERLED